jgi:N-acetylmuramoyl-L-alanine amidase
MRKVFIGAGHSNKVGKDRGAVGNGYIEGELAVELRDLIVSNLKKLGITPIIDENQNILSETIIKFKNLTSSNSIVLDIHWNAATPKATGTEVLIPSSYTSFEKKLAGNIATTISETLNIVKRGNNGVRTEAESHHGRLGWMRLNGENILIEVCFISNESDMIKYQKNKNILAENIAKILYEYSKENIESVYIVQKGDTLTKIAKNNNITIADIILLNKLISSNIKIGQILKLK